MIWATMQKSGKSNCLDTTPVLDIKPGAGIIAYNTQTGGAVSVTQENIVQALLWATQGVSFHLSHWATCPNREEFKKDQDAKRA